MKKILTFALAVATIMSAGAQKVAVEKAKKMSGKPAQLEEARSLIKDAIANPETANSAETYYVAGLIEFDAFDNATKAKLINPDDPAASPDVMGKELLSGYEYFLKALPLDSLPNEKGQVKPKYSKDIVSKLAGHSEDFFQAGADYFNAKEYYPGAYQAFMIYGDLAESPLMAKNASSFKPELVANSYFNAGLSAYSGNAVEESAKAFKKAREAGYDQPEAYIYEIACWQNLSQDDSRAAEAQDNILEVAQAGYDKFGLEQPVFLNNIINGYVINGNNDQALAVLTPIIAENPDNASLYGLRGFVYDRAGQDDLSEADYRKAASLPDVDFETLKNVSKKLFKIGTAKLNDLEGNSPEINAARQQVKNDYFVAAQEIAEKAGSMNPNDSDLQNVLESIDYAITTYFK